METYQSILMAECAVRERQERAERVNNYGYVVSQEAQTSALRKTVAGALITLALWIAPQSAAFSTQHR